MPQSGPGLLSMSDIETLGVLTTEDKTTGRQLALGDNADKRQRNCQCERAVQTESHKVNTMQTVPPSHVLSLIKWSQVTVTMKIVSFQS